MYALPGLGSMLVTGIAQHDYPVIQGVLYVSPSVCGSSASTPIVQ